MDANASRLRPSQFLKVTSSICLNQPNWSSLSVTAFDT